MLRVFQRVSTIIPANQFILVHRRISTKQYANETEWDKWIGKVSGNPEDIRKALETLKKQGKHLNSANANDLEEVERLVLDQRREALGKVLEEAHEGFKLNWYG